MILIHFILTALELVHYTLMHIKFCKTTALLNWYILNKKVAILPLRQNSVFPLFGLGLGLGLGLKFGLGLEFGLGLGLGLVWHLRQYSHKDYFASKWQNNMGLFCL